MIAETSNFSTANDELLAHLADVAVEVLKASAFAWGEVRPLAELSPDCRSVLSAEVAFRGESASGVVGLTLPRGLGTTIVADILSLDADELSDPQIEDACKELANMICGQWLTRSFGVQPVFHLGTPTAAWGDDETWSACLARPSAVGIDVDDQPIVAHFSCG